MEGVVILFLIIILVIVLSINGKIKELKNELQQVKNYLRQQHNLSTKIVEPQSKVVDEAIVTSVKNSVETAPQIIEQKHPIEKPVGIKPQVVEEVSRVEQVIPKAEAIHSTLKPQPKVAQAKTPKTKTNFEQFIAEKLISIVGIAILVLGIFFTVKWAIDKHYINDAGKILIGLLSGTLLIVVAHRLAKNYRAFSSILAGGGIAVLYFSIYEAYNAYALLPQTMAFGIMVLITLLAVILSVFYDKKELAVIALIGGFCTPFFVSNGAGNYQVLFTYLLILNIGMFVLAYFKKWNLINIISYCFTIFIVTAWVFKDIHLGLQHYSGGFLFTTGFFLVFFGMNIIYNLRHKTRFEALDIVLLLSNSFMYLGAGLYFLHFIEHGAYQGIFTICLALFNFIFAFIFFKNKTIDRNLVYLLIALVLTFLSLTAPIQLHGNYITLFWACELVILYWMGVRSGIAVIKNSSIAVLFLTVISLGMDWHHNYFEVQINKFPCILNKAFITSIIVISAFLLKLKFIKADNQETLLWGLLPKKYYEYMIEFVLIGIIYFAGVFELYYQVDHSYRIFEFTSSILWLYQYVFSVVLLYYALRKKNMVVQRIVAFFSMCIVFFYILADASITQFQEVCIANLGIANLFWWHYLIPIVALVNCALLLKFLRRNYTLKQSIYTYALWFLSVALLYILSCEIIHIWIACFHETGFSLWDSKSKAIKVALPILWSLCSLSFMLIGMRKKIKILRIISLTLFSITIIKLFIYDISNVSQGGKIAAFVILGIILLLVSFMYQKIKGLFIEEEEHAEPENQPSTQTENN